jgi:hypothetical protein
MGPTAGTKRVLGMMVLAAAISPLQLAGATSDYPCPAVPAPATLTPNEFRSTYFRQQPVVFPSTLTPSDAADADKWSKRALLQRHGSRRVTLGSNTSLSISGAAEGGGGVSTPAAQWAATTTLRRYLDGEGESGYLFLTGLNVNPEGVEEDGRSRLESTLVAEAKATTDECTLLLVVFTPRFKEAREAVDISSPSATAGAPNLFGIEQVPNTTSLALLENIYYRRVESFVCRFDAGHTHTSDRIRLCLLLLLPLPDCVRHLFACWHPLLTGWKRTLEPYLKLDSPNRYEPVVAVGSSGTHAGGSGGIPFHRHFGAWLVLLHGKKLWHLFPPDFKGRGRWDDGL